MENNITIKTSRSGHLIPVINGIALHSTLNPIKEANDIVDEITRDTPLKSKLLVLGLGHGYLLSSILDRATNLHKTPQVFVIEPNTEVIKLYISNNMKDNRITILSGNIEDIFADTIFVEFLTSKPQIIQHKESISANSDFFKKFLTHKSSNNPKQYAKHIKDKQLASYFESFEASKTIGDLTNNLINSKSRKTNHMEHKTAAINYILNLIPSERSSQ